MTLEVVEHFRQEHATHYSLHEFAVLVAEEALIEPPYSKQ